MNGKLIATGRFKGPGSRPSTSKPRSSATWARSGSARTTSSCGSEKARSPASVPACNTTVDSRLSLQFVLRGSFVADLALSTRRRRSSTGAPPRPDHQDREPHAPEPRGSLGVLVRDFGVEICCPSALPVLSESPTHTVPGIVPLAPPFTGCDVNEEGQAELQGHVRAEELQGERPGDPDDRLPVPATRASASPSPTRTSAGGSSRSRVATRTMRTTSGPSSSSGAARSPPATSCKTAS